jgi:hypothetical protein
MWCPRLLGMRDSLTSREISNVQVDIIASHLSCHPEQIQCLVLLEQKLPSCEHTATVRCGSNLALVSCNQICNRVAECGHSCKAKCYQCQGLNKGDTVDRVHHVPHPCKRDLLCGHPCSEECTPNHECSGACPAQCRQSCTHQPCSKGCSKPCSPCLQPCAWACDHQKCLLPCGSVRYIFKCNSFSTEVFTGFACPDMQPSAL